MSMFILAKDTRILSTENVQLLKSSNSFETDFWICADGRHILISDLMKGFSGHRVSRSYFTKKGNNYEQFELFQTRKISLGNILYQKVKYLKANFRIL